MTADRLEPHHAAARHWSDEETRALAESDRRQQILDRLRPATPPDVEARAARTVEHLQGGPS